MRIRPVCCFRKIAATQQDRCHHICLSQKDCSTEKSKMQLLPSSLDSKSGIACYFCNTSLQSIIICIWRKVSLHLFWHFEQHEKRFAITKQPWGFFQDIGLSKPPHTSSSKYNQKGPLLLNRAPYRWCLLETPAEAENGGCLGPNFYLQIDLPQLQHEHQSFKKNSLVILAWNKVIKSGF